MIDHAHSGCKTCPCNSHAVVPRDETVDSRIALVIDSPTDMESSRSEFLVGKRNGQYQLLIQTLEAVGIDVGDMYVCSALNCKPNSTKSAMQKKAMQSCRERLIHELKQAGIEKVLCIGPIGYSALMSGDKLLPITKHRGRWRRAFGMDILATLPPGLVLSDPDWFRDFAYDVQKFATTDGLQPWPDVEMWVPETVAELNEAIDFLAEAPFVSMDLETTGFSPIDDTIISAGICALDANKIDATVVVLSEDMLERKRPWQFMSHMIASEQEVAFHNAKFDLQHLKTGFATNSVKYKPRNIHCTMMLHYTTDERPIGAKYKCHGLEAISRVRFDAPDYGIDVGKFLKEWEGAHPELREEMRVKLHTYMSLDCYYTARLFPTLWNDAMEEDEKLLDLYETLLMPGTVALADIEHHGILLDRDMFEETREKLQAKADKILAKLQRKTRIKDFNPGSSKQVQDYIYGELELPFGLKTENGKTYHSARRGKLQEGPTAASVLKNLSERYPEHKQVIEDILEYRTYTKTIGTYVSGMLQRMDSDGRLRTSFNLAGTATGRTSSSNPNLQNVPDASHIGIDIRSGFIASPGCVFVSADYKQLEVRIAAELCEDPVMLEVFLSGRDPHQEIAYSIYHKPKEKISKYERWLAKNILFGLLYGRGYESVATGPEQEDIARHGGRRWTIDEVKTYFDSLLATWVKFAEWQKNQKYIGYSEGEVVTPTGRHRRFPFITKHDGGHVGRASFNTPIQGTASDFTLYALIRLHATLPPGCSIVLIIHDELVIECPEEVAQEVAELVEYTMEHDTLYETTVPLKVDLEMARSWGSKSGLDRDVIVHEAAA